MAILNSLHLLEQAEFLRARTTTGKPRQADLRRAISSAYYAVFHQVLIAASDEFVGRNYRDDQRYSLVYRSIDHRSVKRICDEVSRPSPSANYRKFIPEGGLESCLRDFSNNFVRLQQLRYEADYDPAQNFSTVFVMFAISLSRQAIIDFEAASADGKKLFLTLLLFPPR